MSKIIVCGEQDKIYLCVGKRRYVLTVCGVYHDQIKIMLHQDVPEVCIMINDWVALNKPQRLLHGSVRFNKHTKDTDQYLFDVSFNLPDNIHIVPKLNDRVAA